MNRSTEQHTFCHVEYEARRAVYLDGARTPKRARENGFGSTSPMSAELVEDEKHGLARQQALSASTYRDPPVREGCLGDPPMEDEIERW